jgi:DNA mismatch endonuclease Vsr
MADVHDNAGRHRNMTAIRSKNAKPERFVRRQLATLGFHYRTNVKSLLGTPDIVLKKIKQLFSCMVASGMNTTAIFSGSQKPELISG